MRASSGAQVPTVDIWWFTLDVAPHVVDRLGRTLDDDERADAERRTRRRDRDRLLVARGARRAVLAGYLDVPPSRIPLTRAAGGKPVVVAENGALCFSSSTSHGHGLLAVATGRRVGVDLEVVREIPEADHIAGAWLGEEGLTLLRRAPRDTRHRTFLGLWTRYEALAKATGEGLARRHPDARRRGHADWCVLPLHGVPDLVASVAVEDAEVRVVEHVWSAADFPGVTAGSGARAGLDARR